MPIYKKFQEDCLTHIRNGKRAEQNKALKPLLSIKKEEGKILFQQEDPLRGKGNELIEKRGKTSLEKKWIWRISGNLLKGKYQAILKIWTHGNSPDPGSIMGHPCKTNFNGFSTRYNKFYGGNSYAQCVKLCKEITEAEQSDSSKQ